MSTIPAKDLICFCLPLHANSACSGGQTYSQAGLRARGGARNVEEKQVRLLGFIALSYTRAAYYHGPIRTEFHVCIFIDVRNVSEDDEGRFGVAQIPHRDRSILSARCDNVGAGSRHCNAGDGRAGSRRSTKDDIGPTEYFPIVPDLNRAV